MKNSMRFIGLKEIWGRLLPLLPGWCVCWRVWVCSVWRLLRLNAASARLAFGKCSVRLFPSLVLLLSKAFLKLVLVANIIAWPVAYYLTNTYLQNFAYRASFSLWPFVVSGVLALLIALLTVGTQAFRVAHTNPAEILRHE